MAKSNGSLYQRIRYIKSSLDNAEQSFLDNKAMRGELDLMLAEAEFKNLRRKKDVPWNWNRQLLACCVAIMLCLAGFGGWFYAKDTYKPVNASVVPQSQVQPVAAESKSRKNTMAVEERKTDFKKAVTSKAAQEVNISKADIHQLVQSARVELSSSK